MSPCIIHKTPVKVAFEALDKELPEPMKTKFPFLKSSEAQPGDSPNRSHRRTCSWGTPLRLFPGQHPQLNLRLAGAVGGLHLDKSR